MVAVEMQPDVAERLYTAEEFWEIAQLPEYADVPLELINGVIIEMSRPTGGHGKTALRIGSPLMSYADEHHLGEVAVENGYRLAPKVVVGPDVSFVAYSTHSEGIPDEGYAPFAPDLAVEVVSPNDNAEQLQDKVIAYLDAGTRLVWVCYLSSKTVVAHTPGGSKIYRVSDTLEGGEVLPGFSLPVSEIFPK